MEQIRFFKELPSTNDAARAAAISGAPAYYTVAAERQTAGRGRLGRTFVSPPGGTYLSVVLRPPFDASHYGRITPYAAVAVRRAIMELTPAAPDIKWVNDLLLDGKKVCGILAESGRDAAGAPFVILGIGINTGKAALPPELAGVAGHIPYDDPKTMAAAVVRHLSAGEAALQSGAFLAEYRSACVSLNRRVTLLAGTRQEAVFALDIAENGELVVRHDDGRTETVAGGEISLRPAPNDTN